MTAKKITLWGELPEAKFNLPHLLARLIRATTTLTTFLEFPRGAGAYSGGWDGIVNCKQPTGFVPEDISLWEMGTEKGVKAKADQDYDKRLANPLGFVPSECVYIFVTTRKWTKKDEWVRNKRAEDKWKDIRVYDSTNLEQWLSDAPGVAQWLAVLSGNLPPEGILSAEQVWKEYAEGPKNTLAPEVLTYSRINETIQVQQFLAGPPAVLSVRARSRDEATAFIVAAALTQHIQVSENFLSKTLVIDNPIAFRSIANNRSGLVLIARFKEIASINTAFDKGHYVFVPLGADDSHGAGDSLHLSQLGRELESALIASGFSPQEASKYMIESGRDLTILRRHLKFQHTSIRWANAQDANMLLPALFLGRWDEKKPGDVAIIESLSGEPYATFIEKLNIWRNDPHPFIYQIGTTWRLASPLDAWSLLAGSVSTHQLGRLKQTAMNILGQTKPMFELEPEKRFMSSLYGKESIYSKWAREGVSQSLILTALFGKLLRIPVTNGDLQQWVDQIVSSLLSTREPDLWRSLDDIMPFLAEASPEKFLSAVYTSLMNDPTVIMEMFREDPSLLTPRSYHTGLLWALEALAWFEPYLERVTRILAKLAEHDPGGSISNRPINSLRAIYLPLLPQTLANNLKRNEILTGLVKHSANMGWKLLSTILPEYHGQARFSNKTRWREFGLEQGSHRTTWPEAWEAYSMVLELLIPLAGTDEKRLVVLVQAADNMTPNDRSRLFKHLETIARDIQQTDFDIVTALRHTLHHHRQFPEQNWALPENELSAYDKLLAMLQPETTIDKYRFLFEEPHPVLPEMTTIDAADIKAEAKLIHDKRVEAVKAIHAELGFSAITGLAQTVREKYILGETLAFCFIDKPQQLELIIQCSFDNADSSNAAAGFTSRSVLLNGFDWAIDMFQALQVSDITDTQLAQWLTWIHSSSELYEFIGQQNETVVTAYWQKCNPWLSTLPDPDKISVIGQLLKANRFGIALSHIYLFPTSFPTGLIMQALKAMAKHPGGDRRPPKSHEVERLIEELYRRNDYDRDEMGGIEWLCLPLISILDRSRYTRILQEELVIRPGFFIELLELLYRPKIEDQASELITEKPKYKGNPILACRAYDLLHDWNRIPGMIENGVLNDEQLNIWVDEARKKAVDKSRLEVADIHIGKLLSHYPRALTGQRPPDEICRVIERINSSEIISGFYSGVFDKQSSSTRGVFDGGDRERGIAAIYQQAAQNLLLNFPVTASIFDSLASSYLQDAARQDEEAQRDSLDN